VSIVEQAAGRTGPYCGRQFTKAELLSTIGRINNVRGTNFVTKYGTTRGIVVIGRLAPFGIGAAVGGVSSDSRPRAYQVVVCQEQDWTPGRRGTQHRGGAARRGMCPIWSHPS